MIIVLYSTPTVSEEAYDDDGIDDGHHNKSEKVVPKKVGNAPHQIPNLRMKSCML